jgi:hypothetical protein
MQLRLPMTRGDTSKGSEQPLTSAEVVARLKEATKLFVFPDKAKCQVENANAFAVDTTGRPTTAEGNIQAMYRFRCDGATSSFFATSQPVVRSVAGAGEAQASGSHGQRRPGVVPVTARRDVDCLPEAPYDLLLVGRYSHAAMRLAWCILDCEIVKVLTERK